MTEETRDILHEALEKVTGPQWERLYVKRLLWKVFNKYEGVEVPIILGGNMNHSEEQEDAYNTQSALYRRVMGMFEDRDREALEWLGRNIPSPHDKEPEDYPVKYQIADYLEDCLYGDEWRFPKRAEVSEKVNASWRRVAEFYTKLATVTELDLDERRVKTNVWT